jgi:hypothetical protein
MTEMMSEASILRAAPRRLQGPLRLGEGLALFEDPVNLSVAAYTYGTTATAQIQMSWPPKVWASMRLIGWCPVKGAPASEKEQPGVSPVVQALHSRDEFFTIPKSQGEPVTTEWPSEKWT